MAESKKRRKRIPRQEKFKAGDVFWADVTNGYHLTIILDDHTLDNHQECIPICNFSGTEPGNHLEYVIPIGSYKLPDKLWTRVNQEKPANWIICQQKDCIKAKDYHSGAVILNIKNECPELFDIICEKTRNCRIAPRLKNFCGCEEEEEIIVVNDEYCECENVPQGE